MSTCTLTLLPYAQEPSTTPENSSHPGSGLLQNPRAVCHTLMTSRPKQACPCRGRLHQLTLVVTVSSTMPPWSLVIRLSVPVPFRRPWKSPTVMCSTKSIAWGPCGSATADWPSNHILGQVPPNNHILGQVGRCSQCHHISRWGFRSCVMQDCVVSHSAGQRRPKWAHKPTSKWTAWGPCSHTAAAWESCSPGQALLPVSGSGMHIWLQQPPAPRDGSESGIGGLATLLP